MRTSFKTALALAALTLSAATAPAFAQGKIIVVNGNLPGVGFNDVTPAVPIGGNTGVTRGEQRMNVFLHAADLWTAVLNPKVDVYVWARFVPLGANVLGSAGPITVESEFVGAEYPDLWYHQALANHLKGVDNEPHDPTFLPNAADTANPTDEISARFATGFPFYFGLDNNEEASPDPADIDLLAVVLHEMGHGLGFSNLVNEGNGTQLAGIGDVFSQYTLDDTTGKIWNDMTNAERAASALNIRKVSWNGLNVKQDTPDVLLPGEPALLGNSPGFSGAFLFGTAGFGRRSTAHGRDRRRGAGRRSARVARRGSDACTPLTNAVAGKIVLLDRGDLRLHRQGEERAGRRRHRRDCRRQRGGLAAAGTRRCRSHHHDSVGTHHAGRRQRAEGSAGGGTVNVTMKVDTSILAGTDRINKLALLATFDPVATGLLDLALRRHRVPESAHGAGDQLRPDVLGDAAGRSHDFTVHRHRLVFGWRRRSGRQGFVHRLGSATHGVLRPLQHACG